MARYVAQLTSAATLSAGVAFGWVGYSTTTGLRLRRVLLGTIAGTSAPASQQLLVGINITSTGTPSGGTAVTSTLMNSGYRTPANALYTGWGTAPTLAGADAVSLPFNSQSGGDWPWEIPEDFWPSSAAGTAVGFAFVNRANAVPSGMSLVLTTEYEE